MKRVIGPRSRDATGAGEAGTAVMGCIRPGVDRGRAEGAGEETCDTGADLAGPWSVSAAGLSSRGSTPSRVAGQGAGPAGARRAGRSAVAAVTVVHRLVGARLGAPRS